VSSPEHPTVQAAPRQAHIGWIFAAALLLALVIFGAGVYLAATRHDWTVLAAGSVSIVLTLVGWPIAVSSNTASVDRSIETHLVPVIAKFDQIIAALMLVSDQQLISDRAKQIAFRERDRDAFRRAIHEDVAKKDYDAALALVEAMRTEFGTKEEVDQLKAEIAARRDDSMRRKLDDAIAVVENHVDQEQWQVAFREAERLKKEFPDQVRVQMLPQEIETVRQNVKKNLLTRWNDHVKAKNVDDAIFVLRKLDLYVTPQEAAGLEEDARMIFKEKLAKLRVDFTAAVQGHHWREAKKLAEVVMSDFPNTQMAKEVRDMMPTLEDRLRELQAAGSLHSMAT
jgi:hypothetical protein